MQLGRKLRIVLQIYRIVWNSGSLYVLLQRFGLKRPDDPDESGMSLEVHPVPSVGCHRVYLVMNNQPTANPLSSGLTLYSSG